MHDQSKFHKDYYEYFEYFDNSHLHEFMLKQFEPDLHQLSFSLNDETIL